MVTQAKVSIGPISSDTLKGEDLLPEFARELNRLAGSDHELVKEAYGLMAEWGSCEEGSQEEQEELEHIDDLVNRIQDALQEYCPPYVYFGASEGDGACFGFWPDLDSLNDDRHWEGTPNDDEYQYIESTNVWVFVNDHGNVSVYANDDGKPGDMIWDCV